MFESVGVSGLYVFPEDSHLNSSWDIRDYIRLPQKLLSQDRCKYSHEKLAIIQISFLNMFFQPQSSLNSFYNRCSDVITCKRQCNRAMSQTVLLILQQQFSLSQILTFNEITDSERFR